ncbi:Limonene-12-epoxide hydrolase [Mycolicibacterium rhodesiae JS60]|nr:Limonene-12-epoxide hydrolase [Mycolicibacterium rhodesiae JS60]
MTTPSNEQLVRDFFAAMGPTLAHFKDNFRQRLADSVVWESVGRPPRHGRQACLDHLDYLKAAIGMEYCTIEILNIAVDGNVVLSERVDTMFTADNTPTHAIRIMGAVEVVDGQIVRYTDYLDTAPIVGSGI